MTRLRAVISITTLISFVKFGCASTNDRLRLANKPAFLPRASSNDRPRDMIRSDYFGEDFEEIFDCDGESSDIEARFAFQYENEEDYLRRSESSYLIRGMYKNSDDSSVVPASIIQRKSESDFLEL